MQHLQIEFTGKKNKAPHYASIEAAGADLYADLETDVVIEAGDYAMIPTGIAIALPAGFEAQVRPRSGLAAKHGITVLNSPGTIDSDYRGEIKVILINHGKESFTIKNEERIAQLVVAPVTRCLFSYADSLCDSERGSGGFGSTGV